MKLLTLKELAKVLGRSESSVRYHVRKGRIQPTFRLGRSMSFAEEEVLKSLKKSAKPHL